MPFSPFGAAPLNASRPPKVLKVVNPLALPFTAMPLRVLPAITLPNGMTPPTWVSAESPSTRRPFLPLPNSVVLFAATPRKFA